jgi:peptide deformylase
MIYDVIRYPDPRLQTPCDQVEEFDTPDLHQLVADMFLTMYHHSGVGLAAPQIGIMKQVAVIDVALGSVPSQKIVIINPRLARAEGTQRDSEGCLCLPGFREDVTRAMRVVVEARDASGASVHLDGEGLLSRALQHETDHLKGILFIQRLSALKRDLVRRKIRKMVKAGEWGSMVPRRTQVPTR